jgi:mannose-6-phosphate isomerase
MTSLYPLRFQEILRNYGFGNRWMADVFAKQGLPENHRLAETWEVCDRPGESSTVVNGPLAGRSLHDLIERHREGLLGVDVVARCGLRFPLLIKFLDASNPLGEQVHQDDALARRHGLADPGKTEAWYMIRVRDGATIHCGGKDGVTPQVAHDALLAGTIRDCMREYTVQPGDGFLLYAGTMHYSRGGVLFYEIMQNSDVIIGLWKPGDDLSPRERESQVAEMIEGIHLEEGFDAKIRPVTLRDGANQRTFAFACTHFALERLDLAAPAIVECDGQRFFVLSQIDGSSTLSWGGYQESLRPGNSCLLPASIGPVRIEPLGTCSLLKAYVPDLVRDVIAPLRASGVADAEIAGLGGTTILNPLAPLL